MHLLCESLSYTALFHRFGYKAPFILCLVLTVIDFILRVILIERRNNPKEWFETTDTSASSQQNRNNTAVGDSSCASDDLSNIESFSIRSENSMKSKKGFAMMQILRFPRFLTALLTSFIYGLTFNVFEVIQQGSRQKTYLISGLL